jgi:ACS family D-galactonate transporter-like MFS transporter
MTATGDGPETPREPSRGYAWIVVGLLWGVALLNYLDRQMLSTLQGSMKLDIAELRNAENFGRLMAVFLWIYALMSPVTGLIADRISRKWIITGSLFVWSGVTLAMGFATTFSELYALRALMGISEALYIPAGLALIADYHRGRTRSLAIGVHMTGLYFGQALGGFGAAIAENLSWQRTFQGFGSVGIVYALILAALLREHPSRRDNGARLKTLPSAGGPASIARSLSNLLGTASFWVILFYFAAPSFPGWATKNWLPTLFSKSLGLDMTKAGPLATTVIATSALAGVLVGGIMADRWVRSDLRGRIYTGAIGLSLTVPALTLLGLGTSLFPILGGGVLFGVGFGMFDANNMPILCQFVGPRHRAAGYGLMNMAGISVGAVVTGLLGKSADAGHLGRDMALLAVPVVVAIALQLAVLRPKTADKNE